MRPIDRPLPRTDLDHVIERTEAVWHELRGERLFIAGGTGFFGIWLLESLAFANERLGANVSATVLSRNPAAFAATMPYLAKRQEFTWLAGDVRNFAYPAGSFSQVIHAAAEVDANFNATRPQDAFDTIITGTKHVLEFAVQAGAANFLLTSSGAVYGHQPPYLERIPEEYAGGPDPTSPTSAYAEGKRSAELLCAIAACNSKLKPKIARCFAFVGPHLPLDEHFAIGNFIRDALGPGDIAVKGNGTPYRSYMHAADLTVWLWTILMRGEGMRPYNVGSDDAVSISELAHRVAAAAPVTKQVSILGQPGTAPPERYVPDVGRARRELGLDVAIGLDDAIRRTMAWLQPVAQS